jgi:anti-anti-sigma factor
LPEVEFTADRSVALEDGDVALFYTDGLVEAHRRGEPLFGIDRAIEIIRANQSLPAAEIVAALHEAACQYVAPGRPPDDITLVIVKVLGVSAASAPPIEQQLDGSAAAVSPLGNSSDGQTPIGTTWFTIEQSDDITIVRFANTEVFDTEGYARLHSELMALVERHQPRKLLLDLSNIRYCSTAFINTLLMVQKRIQSWAGLMKLFGLREVVLETLNILGLIGTVFSVCADEAAARTAL